MQFNEFQNLSIPLILTAINLVKHDNYVPYTEIHESFKNAFI